MKKILILIMICIIAVTMFGCDVNENQAVRVSHNLSQEADNFNVIRELRVINGITNDITFQMIGKMSIQPDPAQNQLEVIVELEGGNYRKHFIGLSDNTSYVVEDLGNNNVSKYQYELNFNPKMWIPVKPKYVD
jgi:hypothetical protein